MRASARTRPTFLSRKVGKSIRSDAQPFGFPHVLGQTGEAVNSLRSNRRPLVSCLPCAARLRVSRSWWAVCLPSLFLVIANLAQQGVAISWFRLPQSLTDFAMDSFWDAEGAKFRRRREVYLPRRAQRALRMWGKAERNGCRLHEAVLSA